MSFGGGADRGWLIPLDAEGNRPSEHLGVEERVIGSHAGVYAGLNLANPQPGMEYKWMIDPNRAGTFDSSAHAQIQQARGRIVKKGDPAYAVQAALAGEMEPAELDSNVTYNELCLVEIREEDIREQHEANAALNQRRLRRGPEEAFVNQGSQGESEYSGGRGPTRFRLQDHHSELQSDGRAEEIITPDAGIVQTQRIAR